MTKITTEESIIPKNANIICDTCGLITGRAWTVGGLENLQICHKCLRHLAISIIQKL